MKLKPCPFCGSEPEGPEKQTIGDGYSHQNQYNYWIECINVNCSALIEGDTEKEVITAWNTRHDG